MPNRRDLFVGVSCLATLTFAASAWATVDNLKSFKQAYPGKESKAYSCKICHQSAIGKKGDLNAYGLSLQKLKAPVDAKKLSEADFRAIEQDDADGDGASNLDEITAGTWPGDPASVPKGVVVPMPQTEEQAGGAARKQEGDGEGQGHPVPQKEGGQ